MRGRVQVPGPESQYHRGTGGGLGREEMMGVGVQGLAAAELHVPHQTRLNAESSENY